MRYLSPKPASSSRWASEKPVVPTTAAIPFPAARRTWATLASGIAKETSTSPLKEDESLK